MSVKEMDTLYTQRKNEVSCDIQFGTVDGTLVFGHKIDLITGGEFHGTLEIYNPITKTGTMDILSKQEIYG